MYKQTSKLHSICSYTRRIYNSLSLFQSESLVSVHGSALAYKHHSRGKRRRKPVCIRSPSLLLFSYKNPPFVKLFAVRYLATRSPSRYSLARNMARDAATASFQVGLEISLSRPMNSLYACSSTTRCFVSRTQPSL